GCRALRRGHRDRPADVSSARGASSPESSAASLARGLRAAVSIIHTALGGKFCGGPDARRRSHPTGICLRTGSVFSRERAWLDAAATIDGAPPGEAGED